MGRVSYEIRTSRGASVFSFDNKARAQQALIDAQARLNTKLRLIEVTRVEREVES